MKYDFSGYATKYGLKCSDGRIIQKDAFKHQDGQIVPLVWQHLHDDPKNVLGHAKLENREDSVYCYATFNESENGKNAKQLVKHGDVLYLSIYANKLKQKGASVLHGAIREVSLVLSGANPGAVIENISFAHADGSYVEDDTEVIITTGIELTHGDDAPEDVTGKDPEGGNDPAATLSMSDIYDSMNDDQKALFNSILDQQDVSLESLTHADGKGGKGKSVKDIFNTFTDEQKDVVYFLIENALGNTGTGAVKKDDTVKHYDEGDKNMKHNVFDATDDKTTKQVTLTRDQMASIIAGARKHGSLKDSFLAHAEEYGFDPVDFLFPDARLVNAGEGPILVKREDAWVSTLLGEATHSPFSRIKTVVADITADEARAKGYVTGTEKVDEVIALMKRITTPTTIYKKQRLDRDDLLDITDFEVIAWLKREMRGMLNEELARAILVGDGRGVAEADKINEGNIRPIFTDAALYTKRIIIEPDATIAEIIDSFIRARKYYKGSGTPSLYVSTDLLTDMLLVKDSLGRRLYDNEQDLASVLRVSKIVEVELLNNIKRVVQDGGGLEPDLTNDLLGIVVNMKDYVIGADKGGELNMFDDFDIDFNQYKYLIETRVSGALVRPKAALVIERPTTSEPVVPEE